MVKCFLCSFIPRIRSGDSHTMSHCNFKEGGRSCDNVFDHNELLCKDCSSTHNLCSRCMKPITEENKPPETIPETPEGKIEMLEKNRERFNVDRTIKYIKLIYFGDDYDEDDFS